LYFCPGVLRTKRALGADFTRWLKEDGPGRFFCSLSDAYAEYTELPEVGKEFGFNKEVPASFLWDKLGNQEANDSAFVPINGLLGS
jgi:hypothetical protein